jgi:hypothetical protein
VYFTLKWAHNLSGFASQIWPKNAAKNGLFYELNRLRILPVGQGPLEGLREFG